MKRLICLFVGVVSAFQLVAQTNYGPNKIYYQAVSTSAYMSAKLENKKYRADANGDGIKDLIVTTTNQIYAIVFDVSGNYRVREVPIGGYGRPGNGSTVAGDFNGDGILDVAWYNASANDIIISYWTSNDATGLPLYSTPARINVTGIQQYQGVYALDAADIDSDGDVDMLAFGPSGAQKPHMIINNGGGSFKLYDLHADGVNQWFSQSADMNNDGKLDVTAASNDRIDLYMNTGSAGNPSIPVYSRQALLTSVDIAGFNQYSGYYNLVDFNQDGKMDIIVNYEVYNQSTGVTTAKTKVFINTGSAGVFTFMATELVSSPTYPSYERIGGHGARYVDVDNNGILDIISIKGGRDGSSSQKLTVARLSIDGSNAVSVVESTILDYNPADASATMGMNLLYEDVDGDNEADYFSSNANGNSGVLLRRTAFPNFVENTTSLNFQNRIFIGGDRNDVIKLTMTASSELVRISSNGATSATRTENNSDSVTITGKVSDVNAALTYLTLTMPDYGMYSFKISVINTTTNETDTVSFTVSTSRLAYYPKPASVSTLYSASSWSTRLDGTGTSPSSFQMNGDFILANSTGQKAFTLNSEMRMSGRLTIPDSVTLTLSTSGNIYLQSAGRINSKGKVEGQGTLYVDGNGDQQLEGDFTLRRFYFNSYDYSTSTSGKAVVKGKLTVGEQFSISSGKVILDGGILTVNCDMGSSQNIIDASNGEVYLGGTSWSESSLDPFVKLTKLTIDRNRTFLTTKPLEIGTLNLKQGKISVASGTTLTVSAVEGGNATSFIMLNGSAKLKGKITNGQSLKFAVGMNYYNPLTITNNSGSNDDFTVNVTDEYGGGHYDLFSRGRVQNVWNIEKANPNTGSGVDFVFEWQSNQVTGMTQPALYHKENAEWVQQMGTTKVTTQTLTYTGYTGTFSPFAILQAVTPLPLTWKSFTAHVKESAVVLDWATSFESNTKDFQLQRSIDGAVWTTIGVVKASSSITGGNYQFIDNNPVAGQNIYRINQTDKDGKSSFSKTVTVTLKKENTFKVYPNPVTNGNVNITLTQGASVSIYNSNGMIVWTKVLSAGTHQVQLGSVAKGVYTIRVNNESVKVMVQ